MQGYTPNWSQIGTPDTGGVQHPQKTVVHAGVVNRLEIGPYTELHYTLVAMQEIVCTTSTVEGWYGSMQGFTTHWSRCRSCTTSLLYSGPCRGSMVEMDPCRVSLHIGLDAGGVSELAPLSNSSSSNSSPLHPNPNQH